MKQVASQIKIQNRTGADVALLVFNCSSSPKEGAGDLNWACVALVPNKSLEGKALLQFPNPSGWFLLYWRHIAPKTGAHRDDYVGAANVSTAEGRKKILINGPPTQATETIKLKPWAEPEAAPVKAK
jgi:hypothetical protein